MKPVRGIIYIYRSSVVVNLVSLKSILWLGRGEADNMQATTLSIRNIKISLLVDSPLTPCNLKTQYNSHTIAFKIYKTDPNRINVTGLQSYAEMQQIQTLVTQSNIIPPNAGSGKQVNNFSVLDMKIDSIFASRKLVTPVYFDMNRLYHYAKRVLPQHKYMVYYNQEEGAKCLLLPRNKPTVKPKSVGSRKKIVNLRRSFLLSKNNRPPQITLFHTGSVTVMGIKSLTQIDQVNRLVQILYRDEFKLGQQTCCNNKSNSQSC